MSRELLEWISHGAPPNVQHLRLHVEMQRNTRRLVVAAVALGVVAGLNCGLTLFDVWLKLGGRWPWQ